MECYGGQLMCGMRHPTTGLSEDDLSRLTNGSSSSSSSSSASTTPTHDQPNNNGNKQTTTKFCSPTTSLNAGATATPGDVSTESTPLSKTSSPLTLKNVDGKTTSFIETSSEHANNIKNNTSSVIFNSSYLPEFIDPLEWQKSRKRKERLDSTSSITQDRKLVRSNSEEILPPTPANGEDINNVKKVDGVDVVVLDAIRRVSSEDFKRCPKEEDYSEQQLDTSSKAFVSDENDSLLANRQHSEMYFSAGAKDMARRARLESSPARSHRVSPHREARSKYTDESELEHERRRSSERFCKSRAPPGRKSGVMKKSGKFLPTKMRGDENTYKYDLPAMKYERRGFASKMKVEERMQRKEEAADGQRNDYNDNNLIDFHIIRSDYAATSPQQNTTTTPSTSQQQPQQQQQDSITATPKSAEALPWDCSIPEGQTPVLSRRFAAVRHPDSIDIAAKLSKVMPYPQPFHKPPNSIMADDAMEAINPYRAFTNMENLKTREVMQQVIPAIMSFQTPEERLKQVNKRLVSLKKKAVQLEEAFEKKNGYRPSQAEKLNDKHIKNILAEISKLKKEKHELKSDPMAALGFKVSGGMDAEKKLEKMRSTLNEIEQNLSDKREDGNRSDILDELTPDQLVQEKTAVQHGLLFFESLYGRPSTKDERDAARPLYNRYRLLKRMVSRSVAISGNISGAPELPTILEHEAMVFESIPQQHSSNSTDSTTSPSESSLQAIADSNSSAASTDSTPESKPDEQVADEGEQKPAQRKRHQQQESLLGENIHNLSIDKLWEHLEKAREEKKLLKRTIIEYETVFEEQNGRKMLKNDRKSIEDTYAQYKEKKAKARLLQALIKKHISR